MPRFKMTPSIAARVAAIALLCSQTSMAGSAGRVEWLTDLEQAKQVAAKNGKDLLIDFTGSTWCGWCMELEREVLATEEFAPAAADFVLVRLDYLPGEDNQLPERLPQEPPAPHVAWKAAYGIKGFPTVFLADSTGRPYAVTGSIEKGPKEYRKHLSALRKIHDQRDAGFRLAEKLTGIERAKALAGALKALEGGFPESTEELASDPLNRFYHDEIATVIRLDADNAAGLRAHFDDLLHKEERLAEEEAFENLLRKADKKHKGTDEAMRLIDKRIAEVDSPILRNRARRARLTELEWAKRHTEALAYARQLAADESYGLDDRRSLRSRIAWNLWRLHRENEALAVLDKLIAETQDSPRQAFRYLEDKATWVLQSAARYTEALDALDAAIKLVKPDTIDWQGAEWSRATLLEKLGRIDDACAAYKAIIASKTITTIDRAADLVGMAEMLNTHGSRAAALDAAAQAQQILKGEAKSADGDAATVGRIQNQIDKLTGAAPPEPSDKKTPAKTHP
jgi:thioredoxin-related protein